MWRTHHPLLLPLPAHLRCGLLPRIGLVCASSFEAKHKVEGRLLLDVVILKGAAILKLLACEDKTLLVWRDSLLVLDLGLYGIDGVTGLHLEGDGLAREGLNENLHPSCGTRVQRREWSARRVRRIRDGGRDVDNVRTISFDEMHGGIFSARL